jgi:hypothetical protein
VAKEALKMPVAQGQQDGVLLREHSVTEVVQLITVPAVEVDTMGEAQDIMVVEQVVDPALPITKQQPLPIPKVLNQAMD